MTGKLIDGIAIGKEIREEIKERVTALKEHGCHTGACCYSCWGESSFPYICKK